MSDKVGGYTGGKPASEMGPPIKSPSVGMRGAKEGLELKVIPRDEPAWLSAVVVQPGDVLVIVLPEGTTREVFDRIVGGMHEHRPDLKDRVVFVAGVTGLAVLKAERA